MSDSAMLEEQETLILQTLEQFLERDVRPHVMELERNDIWPEEIVYKMADLGLFGAIIDEEYGGSITRMIAAVGEILKLAGPNTKIIPGHGPLADKAALSDYREMLMKVRAGVKPLVDAGKSKSDVISAKPTQALDAEWGDGFLKPDAFVGLVYASLKK